MLSDRTKLLDDRILEAKKPLECHYEGQNCSIVNPKDMMNQWGA